MDVAMLSVTTTRFADGMSTASAILITGALLSVCYWQMLRHGKWRTRCWAWVWGQMALLSSLFAVTLIGLMLTVGEPRDAVRAVIWGSVLLFVFLCAIILPSTQIVPYPRHYPCPHCKKRLDAATKWVCGFCDNENDGGLLVRCKTCNAYATSFECYFCGKAFSLSRGASSDTNIARRALAPLPGETPEQAQERLAREISERQHKARILDLDVEIARRQKRLAELNESPDNAKTELERWRDHQFKAFQTEFKTIQQAKELEAKLLAEIEADTKLNTDDAQLLKDFVREKTESICEKLRLGAFQRMKKGRRI